MKNVTVVFVVALAAACGGSSTTQVEDPNTKSGSGAAGTGASGTPGTGTAPAPAPAALPPGAYAGVYDVPVPPELAAAATYKVAEVNWRANAGAAKLAYNLPSGLVGGSIRVTFDGTFDPATNRGTLTGPAGTSECTGTATEIVCQETMRGLLPIQADMALIQSLAASEYAGPVQHRIDVAQRFIGDPIGIIRIDLRTGVAEAEHEAGDEGHKGGGKKASGN
jgi:hypothetical protein